MLDNSRDLNLTPLDELCADHERDDTYTVASIDMVLQAEILATLALREAYRRRAIALRSVRKG